MVNFNNNKWGNDWTYVKCGRKNNASVASITTQISEKITKVVLTIDKITADKVNSISLLTSTSSDFTTSTSYAITKEKGDQTVTITSQAENLYYRFVFDCASASSNGVIQISKIVYYGDSGTVTQKAPTPVISCEDNLVTITAEGADAIYYTTNGDEPTVSSTPYSAPFAITESCTIKAISTKEGVDNSNVASKAVTYVATYDGFAAIAAAYTDANVTGKITGPLTVVYKYNANVYMKDSKGAFMLIYDNNLKNTELVNGDQFDNITATYTLYGSNKVPELINVTLGTKTTGTAVEPEVKTVADITSDLRYAFVKLDQVTLTAPSSNNFTITSGESSINGYNKFGLTAWEAGVFNIEGIVDLYGTTLQICVTSVTEYVDPSKTEVTLSFPQDSYEITLGEAFDAPTATVTPAESVVVYSVEPAEGLTINSETGAISDITATGTYIITATVEETATANGADASYTLIVKKAPVTYSQVTASWMLQETGSYVLVSVPGKVGQVQYGPYVMTSAKSSGKGFDGVEIDEDATELQASYEISEENVSYLTLVKATDGWNIKIGDKYLFEDTKNTLKLADTGNVFTITPEAESTTITTSYGTTPTTAQMYWNGQNSKGAKGTFTFNCYENSQSGLVMLYVDPTTITKPEVLIDNEEPSSSSIDLTDREEAVKLTLTAPAGSDLYYKQTFVTPSEAPAMRRAADQNDYTKAENGTVTLEVSKACTVDYLTVTGDEQSEVKTLTFTGEVTSIQEIGAAEGQKAIFDLQGRRLAAPVRGINIINGRKVLVK